MGRCGEALRFMVQTQCLQEVGKKYSLILKMEQKACEEPPLDVPTPNNILLQCHCMHSPRRTAVYANKRLLVSSLTFQLVPNEHCRE